MARAKKHSTRKKHPVKRGAAKVPKRGPAASNTAVRSAADPIFKLIEDWKVWADDRTLNRLAAIEAALVKLVGPYEYVGGLSFEASDFDLSSLPTNEVAAKAAAGMMPWIRIAAAINTRSDKELEVSIRTPGGAEIHMEMLEEIIPALSAKKQDVNILEAGAQRLSIVLDRVIGKEEMTRVYAADDRTEARVAS